MSLTGPIFLDGTIALTIAAFVALVVLWPRLTSRSPWAVGGRVGALVLVNALVLLTAATQLNATYLFFASWGDLRGAMSGHLVQTSLHRGGGERRAASLAVTGAVAPVAAHPVALPGSAGSGLTVYTVHGPLSGLTGRILVQLPPGYDSAAQAHLRYPVLEAFHGYPSLPLAWIRYFHLDRLVAQAVADHRLRAPVVVMPSIEIPPGVDTEGVNGLPGEPQVETWLTRDVPDWVGEHFRVLGKRDAWATIGYSAGGYDAAMAPILHPAQYGAGIILGGYFRPQFGPFYEPFTPASPQGHYYDLIRSVARHSPPVALWMETSHADDTSYGSSARFLRATREPTAVHAVILQSAGHRDSVWVALIPQALEWLGKTIRGFRP